MIYAEVYQRVKPEPEPSSLKIIWGASKRPDIVTITSNEGLHNLVSMLKGTQSDDKTEKHSYLEYLWQTPLVVVTDKMRKEAQILGFKNAIIVAARASNDALLDSVLEWAKMRTTN